MKTLNQRQNDYDVWGQRRPEVLELFRKCSWRLNDVNRCFVLYLKELMMRQHFCNYSRCNSSYSNRKNRKLFFTLEKIFDSLAEVHHKKNQPDISMEKQTEGCLVFLWTDCIGFFITLMSEKENRYVWGILKKHRKQNKEMGSFYIYNTVLQSAYFLFFENQDLLCISPGTQIIF